LTHRISNPNYAYYRIGLIAKEKAKERNRRQLLIQGMTYLGGINVNIPFQLKLFQAWKICRH
jgi:hypothetical protein